jgi:hypothetical protein
VVAFADFFGRLCDVERVVQSLASLLTDHSVLLALGMRLEGADFMRALSLHLNHYPYTAKFVGKEKSSP